MNQVSVTNEVFIELIYAREGYWQLPIAFFNKKISI